MTLQGSSEMMAKGRYFASNIIIIYIVQTRGKVIIGMALWAINNYSLYYFAT